MTEIALEDNMTEHWSSAFMLEKFIYAVKLLIQFFGGDNQTFRWRKGEKEKEQATETFKRQIIKSFRQTLSSQHSTPSSSANRWIKISLSVHRTTTTRARSSTFHVEMELGDVREWRQSFSFDRWAKTTATWPNSSHSHLKLLELVSGQVGITFIAIRV